MKKIAILITALTPLLFASCKKVEERADMTLYITKIGNTTFTPTNQPGSFDCQSGQELDVHYYFESTVPLDHFIYGTDYEKEQEQYLTAAPAEGALSGNFTFHFVVDELISDEFINISNNANLGLELLNEDGVVVAKKITFRKTN